LSACAEFEEDIPIIADAPEEEVLFEKVRRCTPQQMLKALDGDGHRHCLPKTNVKAPNGMASLQVKDNGDWLHICGAALIKDQWAVTAAHCVDDISRRQLNRNTFRICVGESDYRNCSGDNTAFVRQVKKHPSYRGRPLIDAGSDVAVLRLKKKMRGVRKARIGGGATRAGQSTTLFGWGDMMAGDGTVHSPFLQKLKRKAIGTRACKAQWNETANATFNGNNVVCTQTSLRFGACHGDSGGPLIKRGRLVGLVSTGDPACAGRVPDVFVAMKGVKRWIQSATK